MSVKNYAPELLKIFEIASLEPFEFDAGSESKARYLRWRLHSLRREMRKEKHWLLPIAEAVVISLKGSKIIAHPPDMEITPQLREALDTKANELTEKLKEGTGGTK